MNMQDELLKELGKIEKDKQNLEVNNEQMKDNFAQYVIRKEPLFNNVEMVVPKKNFKTRFNCFIERIKNVFIND